MLPLLSMSSALRAHGGLHPGISGVSGFEQLMDQQAPPVAGREGSPFCASKRPGEARQGA